MTALAGRIDRLETKSTPNRPTIFVWCGMNGRDCSAEIAKAELANPDANIVGFRWLAPVD